MIGRNGLPWYEVDLERCPTAAAVLDWIAQVEQKGWASPTVVGHLVAALCDLLDPQAHLCSWGMNQHDEESTEQVRRRITSAEVRTLAWRLTNARLDAKLAATGAGSYSVAELCEIQEQSVRAVRGELVRTGRVAQP
jgi:hypothetical protein